MENNKKEVENEDDIDVRKIYLRNFKPHQPRIGKEYQAVIPECISAPKKKENKADNEKKIFSEKNINNIENKEKIENNEKILKNNNIKIKNDILGHKTHKDKNQEEKEEDYIPSKKKKINNDI